MYFFSKSKHWGISVFGEAIFAEHTEWLIGVPVVYRANDKVWLRAGIGMELVRNAAEELEIHKDPLVRVGGGYDFHMGKLTLSPSLDIDIVRKHAALVAGLNIGFGF